MIVQYGTIITVNFTVHTNMPLPASEEVCQANILKWHVAIRPGDVSWWLIKDAAVI